MLAASNYLATSLAAPGTYAEAEQMQRKVHAVQKQVLGTEHCGTLVIASNLALSLYDQGMYTEAEQVQREVLEALKCMRSRMPES